MMEIETMSDDSKSLSLADYCPLQEAADILNYKSTGTLRMLCREGKIPAVKLGKMWFVNKAWVADKQKEPVSPIGARGQARK